MMGSLKVSAIASTSRRCSAVNTAPQGFDGLLTTIQAVFSSIKDSSWVRSISHDFSGC